MKGYLDNVAAEVQSGPSSPIRLTDGEASAHPQRDDGVPPVAIDEIIAFFRRRGLAVGDSVLGPVHGPDSPQFGGNFVLYRTDEYGSAFHYDNDSRVSGYIEYEEFLQSELAQRLRFWDRRFELPTGELDGVVDDRPPYREKPIAAKRPLSDNEYGTFVSDTESFIKRELRDRHEERLKTVLDRGMDPSSRESGVARLRRIVFNNDQSVLCRVRRPPSADRRRRESIEEAHGIREGNTVVLRWETDSSETDWIDGFVQDVSGTNIRIDTAFGARSNEEGSDSVIRRSILRTVVDGTAEQREYSAFRSIASSYRDVLSGSRPLEFSSARDLEFNVGFDLDMYQERAAVDALLADDVFCIHGPPGTGKTRTLVAIIEQAVQDGDRVLVTAHSNQAVDNIVMGEGRNDRASLHGIVRAFADDEERPSVELVRPASSPSAIDAAVEERYYVESNRAEGAPSADIVATTTNLSAAIGTPDGSDFDLVIVDEATQASAPATAVPFGRGRRLTEDEHGRTYSTGLRTILAGDHKQLPPYVADREMRRRGFHRSLFEHLLDVYGDHLSQTLYRQYRMHEEIAQFPNEEFYDGELTHAEDNRTATIDGLRPLEAIHHTEPDERDDATHSVRNETEARLAAAQVRRSLDAGVEPSDIGVVAAYNAQRVEIRNALKREFGNDTAGAVDVATIDRFQGSQREVIIVSFTRSNLNNDSGFLESPPTLGRKRLNVALTRAKKRLVLIGNWNTLSTPATFRSPSESCADTFERLRQHLQQQDALSTAPSLNFTERSVRRTPG